MRLLEKSARRTIVQRVTVLARRRTKTLALDGGDGGVAALGEGESMLVTSWGTWLHEELLRRRTHNAPKRRWRRLYSSSAMKNWSLRKSGQKVCVITNSA